MPKPYHKNVSGDFYVEDRCCTACGIPEFHAPEVFTFGEGNFESCYVKKQPINEAETMKVINAMRDAEVDCIWYKGKDELIKERIRRANLGSQIDEENKE